jgi:hypothetical protein
VANSNIIGTYLEALFVHTHNTLFVACHDNGNVLIWLNGSLNPTTTILANLSTPNSLFVTSAEEIFVDNGNRHKRVERWTSNGTQLPSPMSICSTCHGLFVDSNDRLYCSQHAAHQVVRSSLQNPSSPTTIVAGTGCAGSAMNMLNNPWGIFVTENFDLYVADFLNSRIQLFRSGELQGTTVAGNGSNETTITLQRPTGVMLDQDGYLFIVDNLNHRIIGSDRWGLRCVAGCSGSSGLAANQFRYPVTINFDRDGNMLVLDVNNDRVQKFFLATNSCDGQSKKKEQLRKSLLLLPLIDSIAMSSLSMTTSRTDQLISTAIIPTTRATGQKTIINECKSL